MMSAPSLEDTLGVLEISAFAVLAMFGFTTIQAHRYFGLCSTDRALLKCGVLFVWMANLMTVIGLTYWVYTVTIRPNSEIGSLNRSPLLTVITIFFGIMAVRTVQAIMTYRIHLFTRNLILTGILVTLTVMSCAGGLATGVKALRMRDDIDAFQHENRALLGGTLFLEAFTDICLAGVTCWYLRQDRWRGVQTRTKIQLNTLIRWSLESGTFTSAIVLSTALCFICLTDSFWWIGFWVAVPAVYSNSLLALLNGRKYLAEIAHTLPRSSDTRPFTAKNASTGSAPLTQRFNGALTTSFWVRSEARSSVSSRLRSGSEPPVHLAHPFTRTSNDGKLRQDRRGGTADGSWSREPSSFAQAEAPEARTHVQGPAF